MWSQVHILTSYCFCGAHWLRIAQCRGSAKLRASLENQTMDQVPEKVCQLISVMRWSVFWISWLVKMGDRSSQNIVRNYYSTLCNISEEHGSYMMIWWCRPCLFWLCWFGSEGPVSYANSRWPHVIKFQIQGKNLVLQSSKYGNCLGELHVGFVHLWCAVCWAFCVSTVGPTVGQHMSLVVGKSSVTNL